MGRRVGERWTCPHCATRYRMVRGRGRFHAEGGMWWPTRRQRRVLARRLADLQLLDRLVEWTERMAA